MRKRTHQTIESSCDIVIDTAALLQRAGVIDVDYMVLDNAIHKIIDAQDLVNHAATLFNNRKKQGLITLEQLLVALEKEAA